MIHILCKTCVNTCKQDESVKIVSCPKYIRNPSENEFQEMLHELDTAETNAKKVHKRVKGIITKAISGKSDESPDKEKDEG